MLVTCVSPQIPLDNFFYQKLMEKLVGPISCHIFRLTFHISNLFCISAIILSIAKIKCRKVISSFNNNNKIDEKLTYGSRKDERKTTGAKKLLPIYCNGLSSGYVTAQTPQTVYFDSLRAK